MPPSSSLAPSSSSSSSLAPSSSSSSSLAPSSSSSSSLAPSSSSSSSSPPSAISAACATSAAAINSNESNTCPTTGGNGVGAKLPDAAVAVVISAAVLLVELPS